MKRVICLMLAIMMFAGNVLAGKGKAPDAKTLNILKKEGFQVAAFLNNQNVDSGYTTYPGGRIQDSTHSERREAPPS